MLLFMFVYCTLMSHAVVNVANHKTVSTAYLGMA